MPPFDLTLERLHFPLLGNSLVVGLFSLLHIALAGLSVGFMILAPIFEATGRSIPFNVDLARAVTRFTVVVFSVSTVLAVIMVELMIGLFPTTTMWMWSRFRILIGFGIASFILQLFVLYPYYHFWDGLRVHSVTLHLWLGTLAALFMLVWVVVLDGMGSYMLTPGEAGGAEASLLNPTWLPLVVHRFVGNLLIAGYAIAAYGAWRGGRQQDHEQQAYYRHLFTTGWKIGVIGLLLQPVTGLFYALSIQDAAPATYEQLVHGPYQALLYVQFGLIGLLATGSHFLLRSAQPAFRFTWLDAAVPLAAVFMVFSIGQTNVRRAFLYVLVALLLWSVVRHEQSGRSAVAWSNRLFRPLAVGLGIVSILIYLTMGTIRETVRRPDTVRGTISLADEQRHPAADRKSHSEMMKAE
jgi:hypothetical protein